MTIDAEETAGIVLGTKGEDEGKLEGKEGQNADSGMRGEIEDDKERIAEVGTPSLDNEAVTAAEEIPAEGGLLGAEISDPKEERTVGSDRNE